MGRYRKIPPILNFQVGFFSFKLDVFPLFEIWEIFFHLNFISIKKEKKTEKLFLTTKNPRFSNFKSDFFPIEKVFSQIFENTEIFFHLKVISKKKKKKSEKLFREQKPPILTLEVGFFSDRKFF